MGIIKSINSWEVTAGEAVGGVIVDTLNRSAEFICGLRETYPNSFFDKSFGRGLANAICSRVGYDPIVQSSLPFTGGQCVGVFYLVTTFQDATTASPSTVTNRVSGAVVGIRYDFAGSITVDGEVLDGYVAQLDAASPPQSAVTSVFYIPQGTEPPGNNTVNITSVEREDGLADNCGDPPPTSVDPERNLEDFSDTITVCDVDENGTAINCVEVDVFLPQKEAYEFPICIEVDGKKICLDADGWSIEDAPQVDAEGELEEEEEPETEEVEVLAGVKIEVTVFPTRGTTFVNENPESINFYAGYFSWKRSADGDQLPGELVPIRRPLTYFEAPDGVTEYDIFTVNGAEISVLEIKKTVTIEVETVEEE